MAGVKEVFCLKNTHPAWLDDLADAITRVPDSIFFDGDGSPLKSEVKGFDRRIYDALSLKFRGRMTVKRNVELWSPLQRFEIDMALSTSPGTLIEIEKGKLPRVELDILKIASAILRWPDEYGYGCLLVPANYIELKLAGRRYPYEYVTGHLLPLAQPLLDSSSLRDFCVVGYLDPRGRGRET